MTRTRRTTFLVVMLIAFILTLFTRVIAARATPSSSSFQPYKTTCIWLMPADSTPGQYVFPQTFVGCDISTPTTCGENFQIDHYSIDSLADQEFLAGLEANGLHYAGEDSKILDSYDEPVNNAACETSEPPPSSIPPSSSTPAPSSSPPVTAITSSKPVHHKPPQHTKSHGPGPVTSSIGPATSTHRALTTSAVPVAHQTPLAKTGVKSWMMVTLAVAAILVGIAFSLAFKPRRNH
jgi:hypothetical protein